MRQWQRRGKIWRTAALLAGAALLLWYALCLPRRLFDAPLSSVVTDRRGELLGARIAPDGQWRFPPCDTVPEKFAAAIIAFEDRTFRWHPGINPAAIIRAMRQNMGAGRVVSGGSTITMQVIRLSRNRPRTMGEKFIEAALATRLELKYSKNRILAMYASNAPFGGNVVGIDAAAWRYFGHSPAGLSWAEAAMLAVLPNSPAMLHLARNREALKVKRDRLLHKLFSGGTISEGTYALAIEEPLPTEPVALPVIAPHVVARLAGQYPGHWCATTLDAHLQQMLEGVLDRWNEELSRSDIRNLAAIVIDVAAGEVAAYCGNVNFADGRSSGQVDIVRAPRSSGSILKPLLYCASLQEGVILPHTLLPDIPVNINGFAPRNFNARYDGAVPAAEALARSLNVPCVELLRRYSVPKFHSLLRKTGFSTINRTADHYGLSLILGGADVTLWDVSGAYFRMARSFCERECPEPALVLSTDRDGSGAPERAPHAIPFERAAVWQTLEAIKEVNRPEEIDWRVIPSMQTIGWKTGTSYGFRDGWAVGVTPRWVVGVWAGNANGEGKAGLTGASTAGPVMFDIFSCLPASGGWFDQPGEDMIAAAVCRRSGHLAGRFCPEADTVLICPEGIKTAGCPYHMEIKVTPDSRYRLRPDQGGADALLCSWFVLPPAWEWYYRHGHPSYRPLPPWRDGGQAGHNPMQFIYPQNGARLTSGGKSGGGRAPVVFRIAHTYPSTTIYWHLDDDYAGATTDFHQMPFEPAPGRHTVTAVDAAGNSASVAFSVD